MTETNGGYVAYRGQKGSVVIMKSGEVLFEGDLDVDEASKSFWEHVKGSIPFAQPDSIAYQKQLEEEVTRLHFKVDELQGEKRDVEDELQKAQASLVVWKKRHHEALMEITAEEKARKEDRAKLTRMCDYSAMILAFMRGVHEMLEITDSEMVDFEDVIEIFKEFESEGEV
jgi:hypothetical protein